jgi:hypothetical protein
MVSGCSLGDTSIVRRQSVVRIGSESVSQIGDSQLYEGMGLMFDVVQTSPNYFNIHDNNNGEILVSAARCEAPSGVLWVITLTVDTQTVNAVADSDTAAHLIAVKMATLLYLYQCADIAMDRLLELVTRR